MHFVDPEISYPNNDILLGDCFKFNSSIHPGICGTQTQRAALILDAAESRG